MNWQELLNQLLPVIGEEGIRRLKVLLDKLTQDQEGWKKTMLGMVADAIEEHGPGGLVIALDAINDLIGGQEADIDWANPRRASDMIAALQNAEADEKTAMHDFGVEVSLTLGILLSGLLKGLITTL